MENAAATILDNTTTSVINAYFTDDEMYMIDSLLITRCDWELREFLHEPKRHQMLRSKGLSADEVYFFLIFRRNQASKSA